MDSINKIKDQEIVRKAKANGKQFADIAAKAYDVVMYEEEPLTHFRNGYEQGYLKAYTEIVEALAEKEKFDTSKDWACKECGCSMYLYATYGGFVSTSPHLVYKTCGNCGTGDYSTIEQGERSSDGKLSIPGEYGKDVINELPKPIYPILIEEKGDTCDTCGSSEFLYSAHKPSYLGPSLACKICTKCGSRKLIEAIT